MSQPDLAGLRLLLVDDESLILMLLEDMAADLGCIVAGTAAGVAQGRSLAETLAIDAAVIDLNLGRGNSYPIAQALAARRIPFVFATGYGPEGLAAEWRGRPVLAKPFHQDDLAAALAALRLGS
jgi:CheY-like chemotaxis protein